LKCESMRDSCLELGLLRPAQCVQRYVQCAAKCSSTPPVQ
jgi:hypothetical protein